LGEKRIACGLRGLPSGLSLRVIDTVYCGEPGNDACGSIDIIIFHPQEDSVVWPKGSKRSYGFAMTVGTVAQMQALGYYCE
jgi:hypothetical protein